MNDSNLSKQCSIFIYMTLKEHLYCNLLPIFFSNFKPFTPYHFLYRETLYIFIRPKLFSDCPRLLDMQQFDFKFCRIQCSQKSSVNKITQHWDQLLVTDHLSTKTFNFYKTIYACLKSQSCIRCSPKIGAKYWE